MMKRILASALVSVFPMIALAQYNPSQGVTGLFALLGSWLHLAVPIIISLAVVWFIWNVFTFIMTTDETKKATAKMGMVWGIVGIFVMVSIWGLVAILQSTFGTSGVSTTIGNQLPI